MYCISSSRHTCRVQEKVLHCAQNELQILSAFISLILHVISPVKPEKADAIYSVCIFRHPGISDTYFQPERQIFYLCNMGKYREMVSTCKIRMKMFKNRLFLADPLSL